VVLLPSAIQRLLLLLLLLLLMLLLLLLTVVPGVLILVPAGIDGFVAMDLIKLIRIS
jgi:hypothetical protein